MYNEEVRLKLIPKDGGFISLINLPAKYFDPNASLEDKAIYNKFKAIVEDWAKETCPFMLVPNAHGHYNEYSIVEAYKLGIIKEKK